MLVSVPRQILGETRVEIVKRIPNEFHGGIPFEFRESILNKKRGPPE